MPRGYEIYRCRVRGSDAFGGFEEIFHIRQRCPGFNEPGDHIERVTLVEAASESVQPAGAVRVEHPGRRR